MMLRTYVSKVAAGKGRAILEGIGLPSEMRDVCYMNNPLNVEEAIQCGLLKWRNGSGDSPTWAVLLKAMEYAGIAVQHITKLKEEILKGAFSQPLMLYHVSTLLCVQAAVGSPVHSLLGSTLLLLQGTYPSVCLLGSGEHALVGHQKCKSVLSIVHTSVYNFPL